MKLENLSAALEYLTEEHTLIGKNLFANGHNELTNLTAEIIDTVFQITNMGDLEKRVKQESQIDIKSIENGFNAIKDAAPKKLELIQEEKTTYINPTELIEELDKFIEKTKLNNQNEQLETLFSLELHYDNTFDKLLMTFNPQNKIFNKIAKLLELKFNNISDNEMLLLLAKIKSCFNYNEQRSGYIIYDDIIPKDFFDSDNPSYNVRKQCALFIAKYKPLTIKRMLTQNFRYFPLTVPGVARILAISDTSKICPPSSLEFLLVSTTSQILAIFELITKCKPSDLARMVGADENGFIFTGDFLINYKRHLSNIKDKNTLQKVFNLNVKKLIEYVRTFSHGQSRLEEILWQYKLGQEVIHPERKSEFNKRKSKLEDYLQKDISKFLIERNILSFGRKFGRSQIDLYYKDIGGEDFVIETKIYNEENELTLSKLKKNLAQLHSYMDQINQPRGILAIFNFSNTIILTEKIWLQGRILIICINLCNVSPSKRISSQRIVESESDVINIIKL